MSISRGSRLGSYEITSRLGAGGMGEVYRARDTRLQRDVAIKALPAEFAGDAERLARFQREARLLASLNHPNVAAIYGLEEVDGARYLVLEIVEGESLAQRLAAGPLPVEETLAVCVQIAAGVSAAHDASVIHRDLKPGNVMVRHDGSVKVLDFGLAKEAEAPTGSGSSDLSASPTVSLGTQQGVILGTAAYMSPEQARGRLLDKRTDIWSFGCILYECLTGRQVFRDETVSDTLASIIRSEPDWKALPADTPAKVRDLVKRCLQKDPKRRLHDIADARLEIEEALAGPAEREPSAPLPAAAAPAKKAAPIWIALGTLAGALGGAILSRAWTPVPRPGSPTAIRSAIALPTDTRLRVATLRPSMACSPDGRKLVFRALKGRISQLYVRDLSRADAIPIPGTEGAFDPFFSPDGEWLGFFVGNELKKVALSGGTPTALADVPPVSFGATWAPDGAILLAPRPNGALVRLPAGAKAYQELTKLDTNRGEHAHVWPQLLPDGENVLLVVRMGRDFDDIAASNVAVHSLKTGQHRVLVEGSAWARYVEPGYLLFTKGTTVFAASCDPRKWALTGSPVPLLQDVLTSTFDGAPYLAASDNGLLAWAGGGAVPVPSDTLLWVDRTGKEEALALSDWRFDAPRLSPDSKRLAVAAHPADRPGSSVAIYDFARGVLSTLTPEPGRHFAPVWSPDGRRIAFSAFEAGQPVLAWKAADGSGPTELLTPGGKPEFPSSFSPDGRALLYTTGTSSSLENMDLWLLSLEGKRETRAWLAGPARELAAFFSPDGRSVAYISNETGRNEVYVQPYPGPGPKIKVSTEGGVEPAWAPGGREIFYRTSDSLMAAPVETQPALSVGTARALLPDHYDRWSREDGSRNYDVSPDGSRFLFIRSQDLKQEPVTRLNLMTNWPAAVGGPQTEKK
jgi:eukaryotic-like serine/threonine-protein kinase